jgi:capsular polysaccharide biosynthesis protein
MLFSSVFPRIWWGRFNSSIQGEFNAIAAEKTCFGAYRTEQLEDEMTGQLWVAGFTGGKIISNGRLVALADGRVIQGLQSMHGFKTPDHCKAFSRLRILSESLIRGKSFLLGAPSGNNYFHWLYDCLPRIYIAKVAGIDFSEIDHFLIDEEANRELVEETLNTIGLDYTKVTYMKKRCLLRCEFLWVPSMPTSAPGLMSLSWIRWIRHSLGQAGRSTASVRDGRRIFIAREEGTLRNLVNKADVITALSKVGFETHYLRGLSVAKQSELFNSARVIVAQHGAGLANLTFCRPNAAVLEIMSPGHVNDCYARLAEKCGLVRLQIMGCAASDPSGLSITVDTDQVLDSVNTLLSRTFP